MNMNEAKPSINDEFKTDYYGNADFSHWLKKIEHDWRKMATLKKDASKKGYVLDIYSTYLQLAEILLINIYANSEDGFARRLFVDNATLRQYFSQYSQDAHFIDWLLLTYSFGIEDKSSINDFEQKYTDHKNILEETIKDYLEDFDFLNAYKHGYRVLSAPGSHSIALGVGGSSFKLGEFDTLLTYYSRGNRKNEAGKVVGLEVYENSILVNIDRIIIKAFFITTALENMRLILAASRHQNRIVLQHYRLTDREKWRKGFGSFRSKEFKYYEPTTTASHGA